MNRRAEERFPVQFRSILSAVNMGDYIGTAIDLSSRGCRIKSDTRIFVGMQLSIRITVQGEERPISVERAAVRWSREQEFGIEFVATRTGESERLRLIVQRMREDSAT